MRNRIVVRLFAVLAVALSTCLPAVAADEQEAQARAEEKVQAEAQENARHEANEQARAMERVKRDAADEARRHAEAMQQQSAEMRKRVEENARRLAEDVRQKIEEKRRKESPRGPKGFKLSMGSGERKYQHALEHLDARRWEDALPELDEVIEAKGERADAALYWKAYALHKEGRRADALAALERLRKEHVKSRWLSEARALELEVKQASGQAPSPESETDLELKLIALNALVDTDPERAIPLLDKILTGPGDRQLQERALFVLARTASPRAQEIVSRIARGPSNPDLQQKAIHNLGTLGGQSGLKLLGDVFHQSTLDVQEKKAVVQAYRAAGARDQLIAIAETEKDPEVLDATIRALSSMGVKLSAPVLLKVYEARTDARARAEIVRALAADQNATALVALARKEKDPGMKKDIIASLSHIKSKEATDYLVEILGK
jgi:TolA-binding protein